ncbi:MAG: hypothetical protein LBG28_01945 [Tannerella sp.]|jgi:hypothetical protein|nr:hypothetical protein [Tannerella sp.]
MIQIIKKTGLILIWIQGCTSSLDYQQLDNPKPENADNTLAVYTSPDNFQEVPQSVIYEVTLLQGTTRVKIPVFQNTCPVYQAGYMDMESKDANPLNMFAGRSISWVNFSFSGTVSVEIKVLDQVKVPVTDAISILPARHEVSPSLNDNLITFTLNRPGQYSVEIGSNGFKNGLMIFANPMETDIPKTDDENCTVLEHATPQALAGVPASKTSIYFKAGVHDIGVYQVPANIKNIYLEGGAWVYGALNMSGAEDSDVKIFGRGILSSGRLNYRQAHCIEASGGSERITIEGITVADPKHFAIRLIGGHNVVAWTKIIGGWVYNCDGIAAFAHSHVHHCFSWANDDNIKVYRDNILVEDVVLWQLNNGGAIQMGWTGAQANGITIKRVDILHAEWNNSETNRGVLSFVGNRYADPASNAWQKNMLIEDLVTENQVRLIWRISPEEPIAGVITPCTVQNLEMKNWNVKMDRTQNSKNYIEGVSADYTITGVIFDHVRLDGTLLTADNWTTQGNFQTKHLETPVFK